MSERSGVVLHIVLSIGYAALVPFVLVWTVHFNVHAAPLIALIPEFLTSTAITTGMALALLIHIARGKPLIHWVAGIPQILLNLAFILVMVVLTSTPPTDPVGDETSPMIVRNWPSELALFTPALVMIAVSVIMFVQRAARHPQVRKTLAVSMVALPLVLQTITLLLAISRGF
ncbi:hypothetical protein [Mycetocola saprophilus]|uniref:hypothetical protein n=1 Tax=Mycetocola saprophilus TaxID=76636 RepID=UPI003BF31AA1